MPRILLVLVALLLVPPQRASCACAAPVCGDEHHAPPAQTQVDANDDHDHGGGEPDRTPDHRHHAPDCPTVTATGSPAAIPAAAGSADAPATPSPAPFGPTPEPYVPARAVPGPARPPAVPLHVRLQVFRI